MRCFLEHGCACVEVLPCEVHWQAVLVLNLTFVSEIPSGGKIYVKLLCAPSSQEPIARSLSAPTSRIKIAVDLLSPPPFPFRLSFVCSHHPLCFIITHTHLSLAYPGLPTLSSVFVMVHWYITNTIKPFTILQLLAITSQLQG